MMPEVAALIAAVRVVDRDATYVEGTSWTPVEEALRALDIKLASIGAEPSKVEQDRTWGEVVAGDDIQSAKTKGWFEVHTTVRTPDGMVKVMIKGTPKPILRKPKEPVRLRRGVDGEALDIVEVLFSGTTAPTQTPVTKDAGPMLTERVEDDDE